MVRLAGEGSASASSMTLIKKLFKSLDGRYIIARMEIQGQPCLLINCYAPSSEAGQVKIFKDISKHLANIDIIPDYKYICAGDWNLIFDAWMDSFGEKAVL